MDKETLAENYNYRTFHRPKLADYWRFHGGPKPGLPAPEFDLPTVTGDWFRLSDHRGERPVLVNFASLTCPMTAASKPCLARLYRDYGDDLWFVSIYVREAHPGECFSHHTSFKQKLRHAETWAENEQIPWSVAVDWLHGPVHVAYGARQNAAYLIDTLGHVAFRALWAGQESLLRFKIHQLLKCEPHADGPINLGESRNYLVELFRSAAEIERVVTRGGRKAIIDFRREMGSFGCFMGRCLSGLTSCWSWRRRSRMRGKNTAVRLPQQKTYGAVPHGPEK